MKFNVNPDKFMFSIGFILIGFIMIIVFMIIYSNYFLMLALLFWLFISILITRNIYIVVSILSDAFVFNYKGQKITILFKDVKLIKEESDFTKPLYCNKYYVVSDNDAISKIQISNRQFSKWINENKNRFKIVSSCTID
jgi:hypothetical protein